MTYTILHVGKVKNRAIAVLIDDYAERAGHDVPGGDERFLG